MYVFWGEKVRRFCNPYVVYAVYLVSAVNTSEGINQHVMRRMAFDMLCRRSDFTGLDEI